MAERTVHLVKSAKSGAEQFNGVKIPDPILGEPKRMMMPWRKKAWLIFFIGFLGGWLWMTWATLLNHQVGSSGLSFWRLLLPF